MSNALIQMAIFIACGYALRYFKPGGISADSVQNSIMSLIQWIFLPIVVFFALSLLQYKPYITRYIIYVIIATAAALAAAWFWLERTPHQAKTKGALLLAAAFGSVLFIGLPLNKIMIGDWTARLAIIYLLVANTLILYTAGLFLARALGSKAKLKQPVTALTDEKMTILKDPVIIAAALGIVVNLTGMKLPGWLNGINDLASGALVPLLILAVGLSLKWDKSWNDQVKDILPIAAIKLILVPLVLLIMIKVFGSPGVKTSKALVINGAMPASLLGFYICSRFKFDTGIYAIVFVVTSALALIAVPIWMEIL